MASHDGNGNGAAAARRSTSSNHNVDAYDEERLDWGMTPPRWSRPNKRISRRRVTAALLVVDVLIVVTLVWILHPLITLLLRNEELFGSRLVLSQEGPPNADPHPDRHTIPKILHQTAATEDIPEKWVKPQQSCKEAYSDFQYKFWTDVSARNFIEAEYPSFLETWDSIPFGIQKADAIRYFILYHYGGIYLDMDTWCNQSIPLWQLESAPTEMHAVFKSTKPTGTSNDLMITSPKHPVFEQAITKIASYIDFTQPFAHWMPYVAIMISSGPMFITFIIKNYLEQNPAQNMPTVAVVNATMLAPFITDLEAASWHQGDAKALMWIGDRPWTWFLMGAVGTAIGLHLINRLLLLVCRSVFKSSSMPEAFKMAKLT